MEIVRTVPTGGTGGQPVFRSDITAWWPPSVRLNARSWQRPDSNRCPGDYAVRLLIRATSASRTTNATSSCTSPRLTLNKSSVVGLLRAVNAADWSVSEAKSSNFSGVLLYSSRNAPVRQIDRECIIFLSPRKYVKSACVRRKADPRNSGRCGQNLPAEYRWPPNYQDKIIET